MKPFTSNIPKQDCQKQVHINSSDNWSRIPALNPATEQGCWPHTMAGLATWSGLVLKLPSSSTKYQKLGVVLSARASASVSHPTQFPTFCTRVFFVDPAPVLKAAAGWCKDLAPSGTHLLQAWQVWSANQWKGEGYIKSIRTEVAWETDTWILHSSMLQWQFWWDSGEEPST